MSVLCCTVPDFLINLILRQKNGLRGQPLALLGADDRVWAASAEAQSCGVLVGLPARQARVRCPDLHLRPLDLAAGQAEQDHFLGELARWELPVEEQGWGGAWVDLHTVATAPADVRPLAAELGQRLRRALGEPLQPALGWDSGKFTARAAAVSAAPGTMRLVGKADEARFLTPLPVTLLPLPEQALEQLRWLGIRTLGQFAALPPTAIWQRWGQAGKLAQRWALGRDNRPVCGNLRTPSETLSVELDPPTDQMGRVLAEAMATLRPQLRRLAANLAGIRRLRLHCFFLAEGEDAQGKTRLLELVFVEPAGQPARVEAALAQQLQALIWPGEMERLEMTVQESGELVPAQISLFGDESSAKTEEPPVMALAQRLTGRYGRCFFVGQVAESAHPAQERVSRLQPV